MHFRTLQYLHRYTSLVGSVDVRKRNASVGAGNLSDSSEVNVRKRSASVGNGNLSDSAEVDFRCPPGGACPYETL